MVHALAQSGDHPVFAASAALLGILPKKEARNENALSDLDERIRERLELLKAKNFAEADRIREELSARGLQLKDGKDPATGERVTTWEWR
jgi:cysteinyl-tRNA synthetase